VAGAYTGGRRIDNPPQITNLPHEYPKASTREMSGWWYRWLAFRLSCGHVETSGVVPERGVSGVGGGAAFAKYLNLAAIKTMVAAAENEAQKRNVQVTICIMDESGNLLFLQKADGATLNTIQFAQKKPNMRPYMGGRRRWPKTR